MKNSELRKIENTKLHRLSNEEKLVLYTNGDYNTLYKAHALYIMKIARNASNYNQELTNEYFSILSEGFANGLATYDKDKTPYLSTYLMTCANNNLNQHFKLMSMQKRTAITINYEDVIDIIADDSDMEIDDNGKALDYLMSKLKPKDKQLMEYLRQGYSQADISRLFNTTQQNISTKIIRIFNKLKQYKHKI